MTRDDYVKLPYPVYDKREEFEAEIQPLLDKLHAECEKRGLPMFATVAYGSLGDGTFAVFTSGFYDVYSSPARILAYLKIQEGELDEALEVLRTDNERYENSMKGTRH